MQLHSIGQNAGGGFSSGYHFLESNKEYLNGLDTEELNNIKFLTNYLDKMRIILISDDSYQRFSPEAFYFDVNNKLVLV